MPDSVAFHLQKRKVGSSYSLSQYSLQTLLSSRLLSRNLKVKLLETVTLLKKVSFLFGRDID
jgi:hypothetical protein